MEFSTLVACWCSVVFFFSSRRRHTRFDCDWSSDVCSSDLHRDIPGEDIPGEPAGSWLVLSERDGRDGLPTALAAMLGERGGRCELLESPLDSGGDPTAFDAAVARPGLRGVVVVCPPAGEVGEAGLDRARLRMGRLIELVRSLADNTGGSPGLWVVTRDAQPVLDGDGLAVG